MTTFKMNVSRPCFYFLNRVPYITALEDTIPLDQPYGITPLGSDGPDWVSTSVGLWWVVANY